jgi:acetyl-CoA carboxylase biotin carboxyl carrier protein
VRAKNMDIQEREEPWIKRIEELITMLEGTTIGELELTEAGTQIVIRRRPDMMMVSAPAQQSAGQSGIQPPEATTAPKKSKQDHSIPIIAPLTGIYYSSPAPTSPPFVSPGDIVHVGQVVALVEAMKVFNEIQSEVSGRVVALVAANGEVVQKGDALIRVEPL